jgi:hypothetical protein
MIAVAPSRPRRARRPVQSFGALRIVDHIEGRENQRLAGHGSAETIECPCCSKVFLRSAAVGDEPAIWPQHQQHAVFCRLYCDHCNAMVCWLQASNASGTRLGEVLGKGAALVRDPEIVEQFLAAHPESAGVLQG